MGWSLGIVLALLLRLRDAGRSPTSFLRSTFKATAEFPPRPSGLASFTSPGDVYDPAGLERDFNSLWNTGYFEDIRFSREETPKGWRLIVQVKEKPTIREINYVGLSSVSTSDVLDRFKEAKVGLSVESQYDPTKVKKAEVTIKGPAGRTRTPVLDGPHRNPPDSAGRDRNHLCH